MPELRIIPGAIGLDSCRALLLCNRAAPPTCAVRPADSGASPGSSTLVEIDVSPELGEFLEGVRLWLFEASGLTRGKRYDVVATAGQTVLDARVRTLDPTGDLEVVVASCYYDGFNGSGRFAANLDKFCSNCAFKLLVGDNLYVDVHGRQRDSSIDDGFAETAALYLQHYWHGDYAHVLQRLPTYTTWDDHEFWNNYPHEQIWLKRSRGGRRQRYIEAGKECLKVFQAVLNPGFGSGVRHETDLSYEIDTPQAAFFVADVRSVRELRRNESSLMMPDAALGRLESWASGLDRPGVLVIGQPLCIEAGGSTDYTPPNFGVQYRRIWRALANARWDIVVVSGDVHHSRLLRFDLSGGRTVYEFVSSPSCHIPQPVTGWRTHGDIGFPKRLHAGLGDALRPSYLCGTEAPFSIGKLAFRRKSSAAVEVDCTFLDIRQSVVAEAMNANDGFFSSGQRPAHPTCRVTPLRLNQR